MRYRNLQICLIIDQARNTPTRIRKIANGWTAALVDVGLDAPSISARLRIMAHAGLSDCEEIFPPVSKRTPRWGDVVSGGVRIADSIRDVFTDEKSLQVKLTEILEGLSPVRCRRRPTCLRVVVFYSQALESGSLEDCWYDLINIEHGLSADLHLVLPGATECSWHPEGLHYWPLASATMRSRKSVELHAKDALRTFNAWARGGADLSDIGTNPVGLTCSECGSRMADATIGTACEICGIGIMRGPATAPIDIKPSCDQCGSHPPIAVIGSTCGICRMGKIRSPRGVGGSGVPLIEGAGAPPPPRDRLKEAGFCGVPLIEGAGAPPPPAPVPPRDPWSYAPGGYVFAASFNTIAKLLMPIYGIPEVVRVYVYMKWRENPDHDVLAARLPSARTAETLFAVGAAFQCFWILMIGVIFLAVVQ